MCILRVPGEDQQDLRAHFEEGRRLAAEITALFPSPIELEHEKVRTCPDSTPLGPSVALIISLPPPPRAWRVGGR